MPSEHCAADVNTDGVNELCLDFSSIGGEIIVQYVGTIDDVSLELPVIGENEHSQELSENKQEQSIRKMKKAIKRKIKSGSPKTAKTKTNKMDDGNHSNADDQESSDEEKISVNNSCSTEKKKKVKYEVIEKGSKRGKAMLVSDIGYAYTIKRLTTKQTTWVCAVRSNVQRCPALVKQRGPHNFLQGNPEHNHPADVHIVEDLKIRSKAKDLALGESVMTCPEVVEEVMAVSGATMSLQRISNLTRAVNRIRNLSSYSEFKG